MLSSHIASFHGNKPFCPYSLNTSKVVRLSHKNYCLPKETLLASVPLRSEMWLIMGTQKSAEECLLIEFIIVLKYQWYIAAKILSK